VGRCRCTPIACCVVHCRSVLIHRHSAPNNASAAATLLEQLIRPGFDPAQGAEATRRYVRRKANIAVKQYRKGEAPDRYPWTQVGVSERRYYKLLPKFAQKVNDRYVLDQEDVVARMKAHLDRADRVREVRAAVLDVLRSHGFGEEAARKWLQRHQPEEAVNAWPRCSASVVPATDLKPGSPTGHPTNRAHAHRHAR
jgi:hypothetical protein